MALLTAPPAPFVPEAARGKPAVGIIACYAGGVDDGERALAPLREFGPPVLDMVTPMPYVELQRLVDPQSPAGKRNHWGGDFYEALSDGLVDALCSAHATVPSPHSLILIVPGGGQIARVPEDAMALGQRHAEFNSHLLAMWDDSADDERNVAWLRSLQDATRPFTTGGSFLNFVGEDGEDAVRAAVGRDKYDRLVAIKDRYDPGNVFRLNRNIHPGSLTVRA